MRIVEEASEQAEHAEVAGGNGAGGPVSRDTIILLHIRTIASRNRRKSLLSRTLSDTASTR
jgi:hypothetical protein